MKYDNVPYLTLRFIYLLFRYSCILVIFLPSSKALMREDAVEKARLKE